MTNGHSQKIEASISKSNGQEKSGEPLQSNTASIATAMAHASFPSWTNIVLMVSLIFGGCCANVFALEAIIKEQPSSGPLITFAQFILTALFTLPNFLSLSSGPRSLFLRARAIPLRSWVIYTAFFVTVNLLNNWAFAYRISVPLHIIVRSAGPVASLVIGYLCNGKRYSRGQILAVAMLTIGVIAAALADAQAKGQSIDIGSSQGDSDMVTTVTGFSILALAMILSAFQGIYADRLYETYGRNHWKEALFYSHTLSLPIFLSTYSQLLSQWQAMLLSPPLLANFSSASTGDQYLFSVGSTSALSIDLTSSLLKVVQENQLLTSILARIPVQVGYLAINALTQYLCIRGVHLLSAKTSSLTVTIFLNIRKLVSLLLSIYLFGNYLAPGVLIGAVCVFVGGGLYGLEGARLRKKSHKKRD